MPDPSTLPVWWSVVKTAMVGVPVPVWLGILLPESGGNAESDHIESNGYHSVGLFQLEQGLGQGGSNSVEVLKNPQLNATIARAAINAAYRDALYAEQTIPLTSLPMGDIAINSGHPGLDKGKTRAEMRADPRIVRIVGVYEAVQKAAILTGNNDAAMWKAGADAYNGGAKGSSTLPAPGPPGAGDIGTAIGGGIGDALGFGVLIDAIQKNKYYIAIFIIAILLVGLGGAGIVFSGRA